MRSFSYFWCLFLCCVRGVIVPALAAVQFPADFLGPSLAAPLGTDAIVPLSKQTSLPVSNLLCCKPENWNFMTIMTQNKSKSIQQRSWSVLRHAEKTDSPGPKLCTEVREQGPAVLHPQREEWEGDCTRQASNSGIPLVHFEIHFSRERKTS
jgi:hypothetical protein